MKRDDSVTINRRQVSHPVRVRGLKHFRFTACDVGFQSHPVRVRGLKQMERIMKERGLTSHPVRVRGLKLCRPLCQISPPRRTPCGCVG